MEHYRWAQAYRHGELAGGRLELVVDDLNGLGLTRRERHHMEARFLERLDPTLRDELTELARGGGHEAQRVAERLEPIEIVADHPRRGRQRFEARLEPPLVRNGELRDIWFGVRELDR